MPCAVSGTITSRRAESPRDSVLGMDDQQSGHLTVGTGRRLERDLRQPANLGEHALELAEQFEGALDVLLGLQRMEPREAGQPAARSLILGLYFMVHEPSG